MALFFKRNTRIFILILVFLITACFSSPICFATEPESDNASETSRERLKEQIESRLEKSDRINNIYLNTEAENILLDILKSNPAEENKVYILLGMLYKEEGKFEKAGEYLIKAADNYPILRDYVLKLLADIYVDSKELKKALQTVRQIKNHLLLKSAKQVEIEILFTLRRRDEVREALSRYIEGYPEDWKHKVTLAGLLKNRGKIDRVVRLYKDIYINHLDLSEYAMNELRSFKADSFTEKELLRRADNLFENSEFREAETVYKEVVSRIKGPEKEEARFRIGMCRFNLKQYDKSARSFGLIDTPESMYWKARSYYVSKNREMFDKVKKEFEASYPDNKQLALLFLMEAEEFRKQGRSSDAANSYTRVLTDFPDNAEDALWGIGWLNYINGDYGDALDYFSRLADYVKSVDYYKYLYWKARTEEELYGDCIYPKDSRARVNEKGICSGKKVNFFCGLPSDESYYGYLIKSRSPSRKLPDRVELTKPVKPEGEAYERIEALVSLGMKDEAVNEILDTLKKTEGLEEFRYLGYMAMKLNEYKEIIAFAEEKEERLYLPYAYPFGYRDSVNYAAGLNGLDPYLVVALIREESRFDPGAVSWEGAIGLMQIMPSTAFRVREKIKAQLQDSLELHDVRKNILLGSNYLSQLINEFKDIPIAIAAYDAGEKRLNEWIAELDKDDIVEFIENMPYEETGIYVKKVLKSYWQYRTINGLSVSGMKERQTGN
jgi:soluble lytic murein transglycosylase